MITDNCKNEIFQKSKVEDIIGEIVTLKRSGKSLIGTCPFCDKEKKFTIDKAKQIWKCFSCNEGGKDSVGFIMKLKNLAYPDALKYVAEKCNITLEYDNKTEAPVKKKAPIIKGEEKTSFRDIQLSASGLTNTDQKYQRLIEGPGAADYSAMDRYTTGTINEKWEVVEGDDMILHYMDLYGKPMKYHRKKTTRDLPMFRVRWSNPEAHKDKHGKAIKYQSPYESGSHLWINQTIRTRFNNNAEFDTLYMTEGEKKADKATKHGLLSVGVGGINNIANNKQLPSEFQWIIKNCAVKNVVFILDSDWDELSNNPDAPVDNRPRQFLAALRNFLDYFATFNNMGIYLNLYFAYPRKEHDQKGIDDLLVNTLKGKEHELLTEFKTVMNEANGEGKYINCHKITGYPEFKLKELFHLNTNKDFADHHIDKLKDRKIFQIGKEKFRFTNEGTLILAQPLSGQEEYWDEIKKPTHVVFKFNHTRAYRFLGNKMFGRYKANGTAHRFIHITGSVVREVEPGEIKDYIIDFTENAIQKPALLEALYQGHRTYLGAESLSNLKFVKPQFHKSDKGLQYFYFEKTYWRITRDGVEQKPLAELDGHVWEDKLIDFDASVLDPLLRIVAEKDDQKRTKYKITYPARTPNDTALGNKCHFLKFLWNASNFYWAENGLGNAAKKNTDHSSFRSLTPFETEDLTMHFISKLTAIGYLLHSYFDANVTKAVFAMDGKITEVGSSNGRSGKSLIGEAMDHVVPTEKINGKRKDLTEDKFLFENVTEKTRVVFIDDVRVNFDMEHFFPNITGIWNIEGKGLKRFMIPREDSPKMYVPTNHAINGDGGSFRDRQFMIAFSDFYNEEYKPIDEHGCLFFDEWETEQWNMFYNFMACCLQVYFEHGLVSAPMERIEKRRLRQQIGENFIDWADGFYDDKVVREADGQSNIGRDIVRAEVTENFFTMFPEQKRYVTVRDFKRKLKQYCSYKSYVFNPTKDGADDKRSGVEYFTVLNPKKEKES